MGIPGFPSRAAAFLAAVLLSLLAAGCSLTRALTADELRVGVAPGSPPVVYREDGELRGLEIDMARELERDLNVRVTFVEVPFRGLIPGLVEGRFDVIMAGMSVTAERSRTVSFCTPYMRVGQMALIRTADAARLAPASRLASTRSAVGFERGTTGEMFCRARVRNGRLVPFETAEQGIAALRRGGIDYFVHDAPTVWAVTSGPFAVELTGLYEPLTEEYLAWAVRQWDTALRDRLDGVLREWGSDGRLKTMIDRRVGVRVELR